MDSCLEGCAGCFIWIVIFVLVAAGAITTGIAFWTAILMGVIAITIVGILNLLVRGIISLFK